MSLSCFVLSCLVLYCIDCPVSYSTVLLCNFLTVIFTLSASLPLPLPVPRTLYSYPLFYYILLFYSVLFYLFIVFFPSSPILSLFYQPISSSRILDPTFLPLEPNDPQDAEVANMYLSNYERFASTARFWTESYAMPRAEVAGSEVPTLLNCTVLCSTVLCCILLHCALLQLCRAMLCCTALYSTVLYYIVPYCNVLYCTALH